MLLLFLLLGIATSTQIISYPMITESNPQACTGAANGMAAVLIMGGGAVTQPLFGWLMDLHWDKKIVAGVRIFSAGNFHLAMAILPISFVIALLAAFLVRETYARHLADNSEV